MNKTKVDLDSVAWHITYNHKTRVDQLRAMPLSERSTVFNALSPRLRQEVLTEMSIKEVTELLDHLDPHRVHHILGRMKNARRRMKIITRLKKDLHAKVEQFLQFHPQATTSLVHLNYVLLRESTTIGETAEIIEKHLHDTGKIPIVLVSENGKLTGEVSLGILVRERNSCKLAEYVKPVPSIPYTTSRKQVIELFTGAPHKKVAMLDDDGSVMGIVYSDDVIDLLGDAPAAALYDFAGVSETEAAFDSVGRKVSNRYKWLIINLGTAFLAASVVSLFEETLSQLVVLAVYMPIVAGMGGNAATQTLAVMVRSITVGAITFKNGLPAIMKEVAAGFANGLITGVIVAVVATLWNGDPLLGMVLAAAMIFNLVIAGFFGAIIPLVMKALGKDPATSATIFITTATDVFGFFVFLGLATLILL